MSAKHVSAPPQQAQRNHVPKLAVDATELTSAVLQCFDDVADRELVVETARLDSLGLDFLSIVELRNSIMRATGVEIDNSTILSNPSVGEILESVQAQSLKLHVAPGAPGADEERSAQKQWNEELVMEPAARARARAVVQPVLFVLSSLRSGSSLLQLCLEASPFLCAPQELYLLQADSLDQRIKIIGRASGVDGGLIVAVGSLRQSDGGTLVATWERTSTNTCQVYEALIEWSAPKLFCDKTPGYASDGRILARAEQLFASARYLSTV